MSLAPATGATKASVSMVLRPLEPGCINRVSGNTPRAPIRSAMAPHPERVLAFRATWLAISRAPLDHAAPVVLALADCLAFD